jgi:hypothetical protein
MSQQNPPILQPYEVMKAWLFSQNPDGTLTPATIGGGGAPTFPVNAQTVNYTTVASDFSSFKIITMNGASLTLTLLATAPTTSGQGIFVENLNASTLTIANNTRNIDGVAANITIPQNVGIMIVSDGTNYVTNRGGAGSVALAPTATQTITPTVSSAISLNLTPTSTAGQTFIQMLNSSANNLFTIGTGGGNGGAIVNIGTGGVGGNQWNLSGSGFITASGATPDFPILQVFNATTPTTPVGSTAFVFPSNNTSAGLFEVSYYSVVTTSGVGGTNFSLNFIYTDAKQAQTVAAFTNTTFTAGNVNQGVFIIQNQNAGTNNISYSVTESGTFSTHPILALKLVIKKIQ